MQTKISHWFEEAEKYLQLHSFGLEEESFDEDLEDLDAPQCGPELIVLGLPSSMSSDALEGGGVAPHARCEMMVRTGHAYDLLSQYVLEPHASHEHVGDTCSSVRTSVCKKAALIQDKDRNAHGTKDNLRSQQVIRAAHDQVEFLAHAYNANLEKMLRLSEVEGCTPPPPELQQIDLKKDLQVAALRPVCNLGDSKRSLPWIFQVFRMGVTEKEKGDWERESTLTHMM